MTKLINRLRKVAEKRARYVKTRDEIASLPSRIAFDLNIYPGDAERIARKMVYGA